MWHKYRAKRTGNFASKLEAAVFSQLQILERGGKIKDIQCQKQIYLSAAKIIYKPDFQVTNLETNEIEYHEAKGVETSDWKIKLKLYRVYGPAPLHIWKGSYARPYLFETVIPKGEI